MNGIGFGNKEDPLGIPPRGITDVVSIKYWERETFDTGWVALRANGMVLTDQERRVSSTQDRIIAFAFHGAEDLLCACNNGIVQCVPPPDHRLNGGTVSGILKDVHRSPCRVK